MKALKSLAKGIRRGDFDSKDNFMWHVFQTLVNAYQQEQGISFIILPAGDKRALCDWIDAL